ncbi:MAG: hypothetical protein ABS949_18825 [Solibacillus sp.]
MKNIFIATLPLLLVTACSEEDATPNVVTEAPSTPPTSTEEEPIMNGDSLQDLIEPILHSLSDKLAPIQHIAGQASTSILRTIDDTMDVMEVNTTYTLTDIGKYSAPFEGDVHYNVTYELADATYSQEGYYFPYDYWYKNSSWYPTWHRENLTNYAHESEGVQHGFHPSPLKVLNILLELTDTGSISMQNEEQDLAEIGFELNTDTHAHIMDKLFLQPVEYHEEFFDASRCWHFTEKPSYIYAIVHPAANELVSINYFTEMYCDIIDATVEISSSWSYDFEKNVAPIIVPKEVVAEAEEDELQSIEVYDDGEAMWEQSD